MSVLLLHGMGGGLSGWDALAARLAPHLELWDVRLPWAFTGNPDWARDPDVTQWVRASVDSVRGQAGAGPDVIVAHSFAANVALELLAGSDLPTATPSLLVSPFYRDVAADLDWSSVMSSMDGCYELIEKEIQQKHGPAGNDLLRSAVAQQMPKLTGLYPRLRFQQVYFRTSQLDLESLNVPVFLVGGSDDVGARADGVRLLAGRIPLARLEILDGCGHFPMIERPAELARLIEAFIDQAVQSSSAS
ncbi:MAG TPA: alpha/beta hydrolase [Pseudonocardiaceae bacterium]|nr:alpha/beta hydrolase [Pseudonocardiaceae bacterium]